jgi:hypothetical protein
LVRRNILRFIANNFRFIRRRNTKSRDFTKEIMYKTSTYKYGDSNLDGRRCISPFQPQHMQNNRKQLSKYSTSFWRCSCTALHCRSGTRKSLSSQPETPTRRNAVPWPLARIGGGHGVARPQPRRATARLTWPGSVTISHPVTRMQGRQSDCPSPIDQARN